MHLLLRAVLHPASSIALLAVLWLVVQHTSFSTRVLTLFFGALLYVSIRPGAKRNNSLWSSLAPHTSIMRVGEGTHSLDTTSKTVVVVSIPLDPNVDILTHALAFGKSALLSQSTVMYVCRNPSHQTLLFRLPLARLALWFLGGLMQYSRGLLLQLLKRRTSQNVVAIVLLPPPECQREKDGSTNYVVSLNHKGIFAAALKTGAVVVPALVSSNGTVDYGNCVPLHVVERGRGGSEQQAVPIPTPDQVRKLATAFSEELVQLHTKVANCKLTVL